MGASLHHPKCKFQMITSEKSQQSNRQNARHSTGPKTPEGKAAIRFNALIYGLRTRATILERENARGLLPALGRIGSRMATPKPHRTLLPGNMVTSQWLLKRVAESERKVYEFIEFGEKQFVMLGYVSKQRAQLGALLSHRRPGLEAA